MVRFSYVTALVLLACLSNVEVSGVPYYYMDSYCNRSLDMGYYAIETGRLELTSASSYKKMTCTLTIVAPSIYKRIMFYFEDLDIFCSDASLQLFDGPNIYSTRFSGLNYNICGYSKPGGVYTTTSNTMTLLFTSRGGLYLDREFDVVFTAYHLGVCNSNEYDCSNGRCIANYLTCNGYNPCGDYSDCHLSRGAVAGIVIGCVAFICFLTVVIILLRRYRRMRYGNGSYVSVSETTATTAYPPPPTYGAAQPRYNPPPPPPPSYPHGYPASHPPTYKY